MSWDFKGDARAVIADLRKGRAARRKYKGARSKFEDDVLQALIDLPDGQATIHTIMNKMQLTSGFAARVQVALLRLQRKGLCVQGRRYEMHTQQFIGFAYAPTNAGITKLQQRIP